MVEVISESTTISVGLAMILLSGIIFIYKSYTRSNQNFVDFTNHEIKDEKENSRIWVEIEAIKLHNNTTTDRMARIETKLDMILEQIKKNT